MANLRNIQLLRNAQIYPSLEAAKTGLTSQAANALDGSPLIGRYTVTVSGNTEERSILGLVHVSGSTTGVTFFMNEKEFDNILDGLDYSGITTSDAAVVTNVTEADGKIAATSANVGNLKLTDYTKGTSSGSVASTDTINEAMSKLEKQIDAANDKVNNLDASSVSGASKVVIDVTQEDGQITATAANLTSVKLDGYQEGTDADIAATDTLGQALGKLQTQINAMDLTVVSGDGEVIVSVSEEDGKVAATKSAIKDVKLTGYVKDTAKTGEIAATDDIEDALSKLENKTAAITIGNEDGSINVTTATSGTDISVVIKSGDYFLAKNGGNGVYSNIAISSVTGTELSDLGTNVQEAYKLVGLDGSTVRGEYIKIYKDSSLVNFYLGTVEDLLSGTTAQTEESTSSTVVPGPSSADTALVYVMQLADGNYKLTAVNVQSFLEESEFASGVTVNANHIVHGVVDTTSETNSGGTAFLTVGTDGFKVSGIKQEIIDRINELDADKSGSTAHVTVGVQEVDGKITGVTVAETNIADANDLAALSAKTVTELGSSNSSVAVSSTAATDGTVKYDIITDASKLKMSGYTAVTSGVVEDSQSVTEAIAALEGAFIDNEEVTASALNDLNDRVDELSGKTVTAITSNNGSITANINDAAGNKSYNIETTAGQISGLTYVAPVVIDDNTSTSGVSASDSVQTGIKNLYASLAAEIAARKAAISSTTIYGSDAIGITRNTSGDTITLTLDDSTQGTGSENTNGVNALTITNDGLFLSTKWDCGTFDENA